MFSLSSEKYPEVEFLHHKAVLFVFFWESFILFSIVAISIYSPTNSVWGIPLLYILTNTCSLLSFWWCPFDRCYLLVFSVCVFLEDEWCWASFHVPLGHLYVFFWKMSIQVFCLFGNVFFVFFFFFFDIELYILFIYFGLVQFSSVAQSCSTLCDPMNCSTPGLPVHHQLPEFTQTHVHRVSDAIQPSHPMSSPSPPAPNPSQHQSLFQWVNSSHEVAKVLEFQL